MEYYTERIETEYVTSKIERKKEEKNKIKSIQYVARKEKKECKEMLQ